MFKVESASNTCTKPPKRPGTLGPYEKRTRTTTPNVYNTSSTTTVLSRLVGDTKMESCTCQNQKQNQKQKQNQNNYTRPTAAATFIRKRERERETQNNFPKQKKLKGEGGTRKNILPCITNSSSLSFVAVRAVIFLYYAQQHKYIISLSLSRTLFLRAFILPRVLSFSLLSPKKILVFL